MMFSFISGQFLLAVLCCLWGINAIDVEVTNLFDGPEDAGGCPHSAKCTLRNAFAYCKGQASLCTIILPTQGEVFLIDDYGSLTLSDSSKIVIEGREASIGFVSEIPTRSSHPFPYTSGTLTNTNAAQQNYDEQCLDVSYKNTPVLFSSCGSTVTGDTYFRWFEEGIEYFANDDFCGNVAMVGGLTVSKQHFYLYTSRTFCINYYSQIYMKQFI
jgi:hypothetical protein